MDKISQSTGQDNANHITTQRAYISLIGWYMHIFSAQRLLRSLPVQEPILSANAYEYYVIYLPTCISTLIYNIVILFEPLYIHNIIIYNNTLLFVMYIHQVNLNFLISSSGRLYKCTYLQRSAQI